MCNVAVLTNAANYRIDNGKNVLHHVTVLSTLVPRTLHFPFVEGIGNSRKQTSKVKTNGVSQMIPTGIKAFGKVQEKT